MVFSGGNNAEVATISFATAALVSCGPLVFINATAKETLFWWSVISVLFNLLLVCTIFKDSAEVALRAGFLGSFNGLGLFISLWFPIREWCSFGVYMMLFTFFHWSEYVSVAISNLSSLKLDSFLLNHSLEYWLAAICSWLEFVIELYLWPSMKLFGFINALGLVICVVGEALRKAAMLTARKSFTHLIASRRRDEHELITHGIYSLFRHPSYVGWFWWSIGTQLVQCNPLCTIVYAIVSWRFFRDRIYDEEITLLNFFGVDYVTYKKSVPSGLPFIDGFNG